MPIYAPSVGLSGPRTYPLDRARAAVRALREKLGGRQNYAQEKEIVDQALTLERKALDECLTIGERIHLLEEINRVARQILDPGGEEGVELGLLRQ